MSVVRGLKAIKQKSENNKKTPFFKIGDGEAVRVRFLQELDDEHDNFNEDAGLGFLAIEHRHPKDFRKRAACTMDDEGRCWACEQVTIDKGWRQKRSLYVNVLVIRKDGSSEVAVMNQGFGPKSIAPQLVENAEVYNSITNREWRIKRSGTGLDTGYALTPLDKDDETYDVSQHELVDLEKLLRTLPYNEQAAFYLGGESDEESDEF